MADETLRWSGGWARFGPWRGRHDVAYLAVGAQRPPTAEIVDDWMELLRVRGYDSVVTNALGPLDVLPFVDAGFQVHERLHLLARDLTDLPDAAGATRRARRRDHAAVLELDQAAFEPFWQLDHTGLLQTIDATAASRFRVYEVGDEIVGYAVTGRSDGRGYLQRVGVAPAAQGQGVGRALVVDALRWLRRFRASRASVNTQLDNHAALRLYRQCGFELHPAGLSVMRRNL